MRELIVQKLFERQLSMSQASLRIGRNASYLQQFLYRGIPEELREREREKLADLLGITEYELRGKSEVLVSRPYAARRTFLSSNSSDKATAQKLVDSMRDLPVMRMDLPVFGSVQKRGALVVTSKPVNRRARPDMLTHNDDAYGLIVSGDAMDPEAKSGSTALVDPHKPPHNGDTCIFRTEQNGDTLAVIRTLVSSTARYWRVQQHQPRKTYNLSRSEWPVCHTVVGNFSR